jgi:hypothetical protein
MASKCTVFRIGWEEEGRRGSGGGEEGRRGEGGGDRMGWDGRRRGGEEGRRRGGEKRRGSRGEGGVLWESVRNPRFRAEFFHETQCSFGE